MKATKYLSLAALALMGTLASCQSDDEATASFARPDNAVGINVSVGSLQTTRSNAIATDDTQREFNLGDQVCVSTDGQDPVIFQCQDADMQTWAEAEAGKFLLWTQNEMTFKAYYPATTGTSMTTFTLPADQSSEAKIALADYMTRQKTCNNENGTDITLDLERKMARVIVRINSFTDQYFDDQKTVSNVRINSQFSAIAEGDGTGDVTAVTPYMQGTGGVNTTYTALVVPGYSDSGADFITLTDGENNTLKVKGIPELEVGNSYTFNLTVGKNRILVQSVTVTDWTGAELAGGQAQETSSAPDGAINGKFSVSATKQVYFSKGNLRYASGAWSFFDNQYDYYTSYSADTWNHFGWSTFVTNYGMKTSTTNGDYYGNFVDWGGNSDLQTALGTGWFTLSSDEWTYLFNTRESGSTVFGTENARYTQATINTDGTGVNGVILFPDGVTIANTEVSTAGTVNGASAWGTKCTNAQWTALESKGCVFLPAAIWRYGTSMVYAVSSGRYWSGTASGGSYAYIVIFSSSSLNPAASDGERCEGYSVRLVREVTE